MSRSYPVDRPDVFARGGHGLFSTASDYFAFAQMLLNGGVANDHFFVSRHALNLMHSNHLPAHLLPYSINPAQPSLGYGFGLGSRVLMDVGLSQQSGSVGEYGWSGAANTYYWIDPVEQLIGVFMSQSMSNQEYASNYLRSLAYNAIRTQPRAG